MSMNDDINRALGSVEAKVEAVEKEIESLYLKTDSVEKKFNSLEMNIKDLTRVIESQKKVIDDVDTVIKSLTLLKRIGYIAVWIGGAILTFKTSGVQSVFEWFKK